MSDQERTILFIVLAMLIFFTWSHFFMPNVPPHGPGQTPAPVAPAQSSTVPPASAAQGSTLAAPSKIPVIQAAQEKIIVVESLLYRVELSSRGGVVRSWKLKKYLDDQTPPHPLDLVNPDAAQQLGWPFSLSLSDAQLEAQANSGLYDVAPAADHLDAPAEITFHWSDGHLDITKILRFTQDYQLSVEVSATLDGKPLPSAIAWRGGFGDKAVYKASQLVAVFYKQNGKLTVLQYKKLGQPTSQSQPLLQPGPMEFLGIEDQFFTAAFIPDGTDLSLWDWTQYQADNPEAEMAAGTPSPVSLQMRVYVGPKDLALLSKQKPSLEELVNLGWFGSISKPLLFALQWLHKYIPNYGWDIVVFTILISMLLLPIRVWSFRSARKMQSVAPEIRSIQDRYKKYSMTDPRKRKMNEEVMAVYQREGINPMGACLPMLVQIPFFVAFYRMLGGAIELRHAPWIGWIHDLSAKDPYYILPILMAITTYLVTKMTPTPATVDPAQQKMMALMPLMFVVIFIRLSSGLNLYYLTSNVVNAVQQLFLNRAHPLPSRSKFKKKNE
ncbi:MAG: membrane protein insertase YidC [Candidatus Acidiferrales bacterium]